MAQKQKTPKGGRKLKRMMRKSPCEKRVEARGQGRPKKKVRGHTHKGNYPHKPGLPLLHAEIEALETARVLLAAMKGGRNE